MDRTDQNPLQPITSHAVLCEQQWRCTTLIYVHMYAHSYMCVHKILCCMGYLPHCMFFHHEFIWNYSFQNLGLGLATFMHRDNKGYILFLPSIALCVPQIFLALSWKFCIWQRSTLPLCYKFLQCLRKLLVWVNILPEGKASHSPKFSQAFWVPYIFWKLVANGFYGRCHRNAIAVKRYNYWSTSKYFLLLKMLLPGQLLP